MTVALVSAGTLVLCARAPVSSEGSLARAGRGAEHGIVWEGELSVLSLERLRALEEGLSLGPGGSVGRSA